MRGDRETVVVGTYKGKGPFDVQVTARNGSGPQKLDFAATPRPSDDTNSYLTQLVEMARTDGGLTLPLVGAASLAEARQEIGQGVRNLSKLARQAMAAGNIGGAETTRGRGPAPRSERYRSLGDQGRVGETPGGKRFTCRSGGTDSSGARCSGAGRAGRRRGRRI